MAARKPIHVAICSLTDSVYSFPDYVPLWIQLVYCMPICLHNIKKKKKMRTLKKEKKMNAKRNIERHIYNKEIFFKNRKYFSKWIAGCFCAGFDV